MCMWNKVSGTQHDTKAYDELKEKEKINIITKFVSVENRKKGKTFVDQTINSPRRSKRKIETRNWP